MSRRDENSTSDSDRGDSRSTPRSAAPRTAAPRKRRRRPGRILGMWARLGLLSGALVVLVLIAVAIVAKAIRPYAQAHDLSAQLSATNQQLADTQAQNSAYRRRLAYLRTPQGEMTEARNLGYLVPGEVPVVVDGTPGALSETPLTASPPAKPTLMSRLRSFWRSITGRG